MDYDVEDLENPDESSFHWYFPAEKPADRFQEFRDLYRPQRYKTIISFAMLYLSLTLNAFSLTAIQPLLPREPQLPDLVFMVFGQYAWAWAVSDVMLALHVTVGVTLMCLHRYRWVIFRRVFLIGSILFLLRASCLLVTFLPSSYDNSIDICARKQYNDSSQFISSLLRYMATLGLTSGDDYVLCGDLMFSGHTVVISLAYFTILRYTPKGMRLFRDVVSPVAYLSIFTVLISGSHYTIDVLIAYWLTSHVFWSYHQVFDVPLPSAENFDTFESGANLKNAHMRHVWWFSLVKWFEKGVPRKQIPNELDWPCTWPYVCVNCFANLSEKWK